MLICCLKLIWELKLKENKNKKLNMNIIEEEKDIKEIMMMTMGEIEKIKEVIAEIEKDIKIEMIEMIEE